MPEVLNIPIVQGGGPFRETIELDNEEFIFAFSWNQRDSAWYLSILQNSAIIALRLRLVAGYNMLDSVLALEKPPGALYLYDVNLKSSVGKEPAIDNLGNRILLVYQPLEAV